MTTVRTAHGMKKRALIHAASKATGRVMTWKATVKWLKRQERKG